MADLSVIPDADWREAERRAAVIRPLAQLERRPRHLILAAAAALGLAERQTYTLVRRCMDAGGDLTALLPGRSRGYHTICTKSYAKPMVTPSTRRSARSAWPECVCGEHGKAASGHPYIR